MISTWNTRALTHHRTDAHYVDNNNKKKEVSVERRCHGRGLLTGGTAAELQPLFYPRCSIKDRNSNEGRRKAIQKCNDFYITLHYISTPSRAEKREVSPQ